MKNLKTASTKPEKRLTKRQLQALETKDKIYNAAVAIINERGFNNVSIEDITSSANVAKGSFYTYFESKEALVFYTFKQSDQVYEAAYNQVKEEAFPEMVIDFARISYTEYEKRGKGIIKAMVSNYFTFPDYNFYGEDRDLLKCLTLIVTRGQEQGVLDAGKPAAYFVHLLLSTLIGVEVLWCIDDQGGSLADMIADGIRNTAMGMMQSKSPADQ
ncbi:TetR/AcrR family transcriptional regulator [Eubacterium barkeri]|uniref:DNA-binding transcriptional regulator, AcrR family n=1 Tax=Eubacterium barkeri TaxID=1528 RepID=A0A1H3ANF7_EUBBA|nr:TetR/AcrR family transcriptional regulator [Eubacterium barkeri]SDX31232.1 DNA-binding transcriptional regulator, AcrR family [Eubacterium barkeri]